MNSKETRMYQRDFEGDLVDEHGNMFNARSVAADGTYSVWVSMKQRCLNPHHPKFADYGGRGIEVCARWLNFTAFYEDMGDKPEGLTLERKDNNGDYTPSNCKWATYSEQNRNRRPNRNCKPKAKETTMRRVIIESPYAGDTEANTRYLKLCLRDSISRGEAPLASHLLYPFVLREDLKDERRLGIELGYEWWEAAEAIIFYCDLGWSTGMEAAKQRASCLYKKMEFRELYTAADATGLKGVAKNLQNNPTN